MSLFKRDKKDEKTAKTCTQTEKALALINTFNSGDVELAKKLLAPGYIQHNLAFGTGADAFVAAVAGLQQAPVKTTVKNIRSFEDGDKVFLQTVYNFAGAGEQVAFDVFRFEDGKVAEHWDGIADIAAPNPSGHTQIDGCMEKKDKDKTDQNRDTVKGFVYDVLHGQAPEKLTGYIADGLSGLGAALEALGKQGIQMIYNKTHLILAEGNYVFAVSEGTFGGNPMSYYDLFRVENGKIAEHWDVMQPIPPKEEWQNQNGKF